MIELSYWSLAIYTLIVAAFGYVFGYSDCKENRGYLKGYNKAWDDVDDLFDQFETARAKND